MVVGGIQGIGEEDTHRYAGFEGGVLLGRFGAKGLGHLGAGNGFRSVAVGVGPAYEVVDLGFASLSVYGGIGWYREEERVSGVGRAMAGVYGAAKVRVPLGFGSLGVTVSGWHGTLDGREIQQPLRRTLHRFSLGFGL